MHRFRLSLILLSLGFCALFARPPGACAVEGDLVDGIAAIVNGDVITVSQVRELAAARERSLRKMYGGQQMVDQTKEARLSALKYLVDRQLILQEFKKQGFQLPERAIDQQVDQVIRKEFNGDRQAFLKTLQAQGYTLAKFREIERDKVIDSLMRQKYVRSNVVVSPQRLEQYYKANLEKYTEPERIKLRLISIKKRSGDVAATPESQKAIADEIRQKIAGGADFERMAQMYSDDSTRDLGGDWGWIDRKTLNEELTKAAFGLKAGEVSPVLDLGENYYLLMVEARKNASVKPFAEVRNDIEQELLNQERLKVQQQWLDSLREKAFIKTF